MSELSGLRAIVTGGASGIGAAGTVADNPDEQWHRVLDVNVVGIARVTRPALPRLRACKHAAIVYLASPASASTTGTALSVDGGMSGLRLRPSAQDPAQER